MVGIPNVHFIYGRQDGKEGRNTLDTPFSLSLSHCVRTMKMMGRGEGLGGLILGLGFELY